MEKAYDLALLLKKFETRGLVLAEDAAKGVIGDLFDWVSESAKLSATPYDDMAMIVLPKLKEMAIGAADLIDGVKE